METPLKNLQVLTGVRGFADYWGCELPTEFAGYEAEYRAGRASVVLADTNWHATFELTGADRVRYLNAMVSNDLKTLAEGRGTLALLLSVQGRILAELEAYVLQEKILVRTHASARQTVDETLKKYIIMDDVEFNDVTDAKASLAIEGPRAEVVFAKTPGRALAELSEAATAEVRVGGVACLAIRRSQIGGVGVEFMSRREDIEMLWNLLRLAVQAAGGTVIGMAALESLRLEAGIPRYPVDFNETVIPHEAGVIETHVSFSKGCYTGQEIVERVRSRGQVNRQRVRLMFSTQQVPPFAERLDVAGKEAGIVTSAAYSPAAQTAIGMGYVRREFAAPETQLDIAGGVARVIGPETP
ncbi:MAG: glycine cleavage T C-terminal barrel domain-containing protein [Candidatus Acidiferrales bacterium]